MGDLLKEQGRNEEAIAAFDKALSIKPDYVEAFWNSSQLIKYTHEDQKFVLISNLLERADISETDRCYLHYTYAKMKEDLGDFEAAFENYIAGGRLKQKLLSYDFKQDEMIFEQIKNNAFRIKALSLKQPTEPLQSTPIFILGMPRSGTTLVEQIISSHHQVQGAGELPFMGRFGSSFCLGDQMLNSYNASKIRKLYSAELAKVSYGKLFVTDKMPQNFLYMSLILKVLPEAKIVHVKRDPAATCWSNFKNFFRQRA